MESEKEYIITNFMMPAIIVLVMCLIAFVGSLYNYLEPPLSRMGVRDPKGVMIISFLIGMATIASLLHDIYKIKRLGRKDE